MVMKEYSAFLKVLVFLKPRHKILKCYIQDTHWGSHAPLLRCSRCILLPKPTDWSMFCDEYNEDENVNTDTYAYIIIMSCRQHGYPWPSLATSPYHSSPPAGLQGYILCPHIVAVCKFELVVLLLHGHMWGSIGVHHLWARSCFSSSVPRVWFVLLV